jgi:hypothetical protein
MPRPRPHERGAEEAAPHFLGAPALSAPPPRKLGALQMRGTARALLRRGPLLLPHLALSPLFPPRGA